MPPPRNQRTTGEETLVCLHENRVSAMRMYPLRQQEIAMPRAANLHQRVRFIGRGLAVACLAVRREPEPARDAVG